MTSIAPVRPSVTPAISIPVTPFISFLPMKLSKLRDGGSILLDGQLNKSVSAAIRMDGGINSKTRGEFFVATKTFLKGSTAERPMTKLELLDLSKAITRHMANTPGRQPEYVELNKRIREAIAKFGGSAKVDLSKIPTSVVGPNANAQVEGSMWIDRMPGPGPRSNTVHVAAKLQGNGFDDSAPNYGVKKFEVYEVGSNKLVATVNNPTETGAGRIGRGTHFHEFSLSIPGSKIDPAKQYAVVFTTTINGSAPKQVRSEFMNVGQVF